MKEHSSPYWYPWYPSRFIHSENVQKMTYEEQGIYRKLLDVCFLNGGNFPDNPQFFQNSLGISRNKLKKIRWILDTCFDKKSDRFEHDLLTEMYLKADKRRLSKSNAGKASGTVRRTKAERKSNRSANKTGTGSELRRLKNNKEEVNPPNPPLGGNELFPSGSEIPIKRTGPDPMEEDFVAKWNVMVKHMKENGYKKAFSMIEGGKLGGKRLRMLRKCLKSEIWRRDWFQALEMITYSAFCRGEVKNNSFRMGVETFLRETTVSKILEMIYFTDEEIKEMEKDEVINP